MQRDAGDPNAGRIQIFECRHCVVAWLGHADPCDPAWRHSRYFDQSVAEPRAGLQADYATSVMPDKGSVLDIGCGVGTFLGAMAARGWHTVGIEPSEKRAQAARANAHEIICGQIDSIPADRKFDAVTMWDVIEHVDDPLGLVEQAEARVKPGGWLFVETGNYQSADRIMEGPEWYLWGDDHSWYFAPPVLERLLRQAGFSEIRHAGTAFRPGFRNRRLSPPGLRSFVRGLIADPLRPMAAIKKRMALRRAATEWADWAHIPIFTIAARLAPASKE